jgi:hypothetical protein
LNPDYIIIANKRLEDKEEDDKTRKIKWKRIKEDLVRLFII